VPNGISRITGFGHEEVIMDRIVRFIGATGLLLACAFHSSVGHACTATTPDVFNVGNKTVDSSCDYGTIQAAITAATCPAGTKIILNQSGDYTNQHLTITNKNISLIGRVNTTKCSTLTAQCGTLLPCPIGPLRTISGNSGAVITVTGNSNVTISHLTISGGHGSDGGGINYAAAGTLAIDNSTISDNYASNGAGIRFAPTGNSDLYLNAHTFIQSNHASATGGGIRADTAHAFVHIDAEPIWIQGNDAHDFGGGIAAVGGAFVHIGSPGSTGGVVFGNTAHDGGGIAVLAESTGWPEVDIYPTDANRPVRIEQNKAYRFGGGIYLRPWSGFPSSSNIATVRLGGAHVDYNVAVEGSAIYTDVPENLVPIRTELYFDAGHCAAGVECNTMSNNQAEDIANHYQPTAGSTLLLQTETWAEVHELTMRGNGVDSSGIPQGAHVIRVVDGLLGPLILHNCLISGNATTAELMTFGNASASVNQCTIAGNSIGGSSVLYAETGFSMTNSIIEQGALPAVHYVGSGDGITLDYLLLSPESPTPSLGATHIVKADAQFMDPGSGDFHLAPNSPALDIAPAGASGDKDLDSRPRDQDLPEVSNMDGVRDLGAYERQLSVCDVSDTIFCNGFDGS
jgi:hypothetical protein